MTLRSLAAALAAAALAAPAFAQTNLLVNGGLDLNRGYGGTPFVDTQNFGQFRGFDGWRSDLDDDNVQNNSWDQSTPGGGLFLNVYGNDLLFPGDDGVPPPVLTGLGDAALLGPYDGNVTSGLYQQVTATPGHTYRLTGYFISDPNNLNGSGQPDVIFQPGNTNKTRLAVEYYDALGLGGFLENEELISLDAATQNPAVVQGKYIETVIETTAPAGAEQIRLAAFFDQFNFGGGIVYLDNTSIVDLTAGSPLTGDFDYDGVLDADDLKILRLAAQGRVIAAGNAASAAAVTRYDLNQSGAVDAADVAAWIAIGGIQGDYNGDGAVNAADYTIWQDTNGQSTDLRADDNADGRIDYADYVVWAENYGSTGGLGGATAVPEPAAGLMALVALAGARRRR